MSDLLSTCLYGEGTYAFFAKVVKNYDESDEPKHFCEVLVQAVSYGIKSDGKSELNPTDQQVWLPYLTDLTGDDIIPYQLKKISEKPNLYGYGFHHAPEVGSLVVVLVIDTGFVSNSTAIVLGNFWSQDIPAPQLDKLSYKKGGPEGTDYKMDNLIGDDKTKRKNRANTTYYRSKFGTTFIRDDINKVFGFYKVPQKNKSKNAAKRTNYFMFDEEKGNLDIKVENFSVLAKNIDIKVAKGMEIKNKIGKTVLQSKKNIDIFADKGELEFNAKNLLAITAKNIHLNEGDQPKDQPNNDKVIQTYTDIIKNPRKTGDPNKIVKCHVLGCIEINVLRDDLGQDCVGVGKTIRIPKYSHMFIGATDVATTLKEDITESLKLEQTVEELVAPDFGLIQGKALFEGVSDTIEVSKNFKGTFETSKQNNKLQPDEFHLLLDKKANDGQKIVITRSIIYKYNQPPKEGEVEVHLHYIDFGNAKASVMKYAAALGPGRFIPIYNGELVFKGKMDDTYLTILSNAKKSDLKKIFSEDPFNSYINSLKSASNGKLEAWDPKNGDINEIGVVKFTFSPANKNVPDTPATCFSNALIFKGEAVERDILSKPLEFAPLDSNKGAASVLDRTSGDSVDINSLPVDVITNKDLRYKNHTEHIYLKYDVLRSFPVQLFGRDVAISDIANGTNNIPLMETELCDENINNLLALKRDGNPIFKIAACTTKKKEYAEMLGKKVAANADSAEVLVFIPDTKEGRESLIPPEPNPSLYLSCATNDKLMKINTPGNTIKLAKIFEGHADHYNTNLETFDTLINGNQTTWVKSESFVKFSKWEELKIKPSANDVGQENSQTLNSIADYSFSFIATYSVFGDMRVFYDPDLYNNEVKPALNIQ